LFITAIAQICFPHKANGSLVVVADKVRGSSLIGQRFPAPRYFQSRPSAVDYSPLPSGGSNASVTSRALAALVSQRRLDFQTANGLTNSTSIPADMLFASGSGLDPHISPEAARLQVDAIARTRHFSPAEKSAISSLVEKGIENPQWGLLGNSRVNVLKLNIALDAIKVR
jgi:K+-transporting ATPase ATPase C chain